MRTIFYKGHYIHENFTENIVKVQFIHNDTFSIYYVKNFRAAQLKITKLIKNEV